VLSEAAGALAGFWPDSSTQRYQLLRNAERRSSRARAQYLVRHAAGYRRRSSQEIVTRWARIAR